MADSVAQVKDAAEQIASQWRADRANRQLRRHLDRTDFDALRESGILELVGSAADDFDLKAALDALAAEPDVSVVVNRVWTPGSSAR